ncbi:MAG TPA: bifunctional UDP-N-acetylglucosamine diphosphorylase/glucosamine-1-phosphate N-acetyltransferase GlmU [Gordonia sp. (in: high G+C Gram-positive bacteria)]|uniref:bifunctional UDP-N-acetylglucosamine diphosphorylase/glucosamine-1-phosphate N-acetyltransferase GlmU n=1 Tax=unclassified Gordonia (in: high G+C Gram-positive bacteria) TaxID=2657482 RepID=UPI000FB35F2F|nr:MULTISPECIES: bifunctional UDP-N-acetylglucosamine diphosphorylase/glucosamine-1-phosphate N-acetyltransferase GlmU [unclassified Gordonia (in: high G+C Gram-positive bacteria)]RUP37003.1 MAG: bifunctional UDP-N-acetylglucosamine diphosphorylase/glucosamine-1-phosphate N-acetyltransferase GlmU [Gordonia sp. (in: high G+C Gram-positive bacteria)]HNP58931.1 bifunctional UDP-N-acetylglucosamine diphosphorylase/glucosamine-1-phosphate N-acetyltransferase GlmU [Gordonia sp. (in: high G+C Gram-posit
MTDTGQRAVIVLAAGAGTRMKSKTPKILHEIGGRSLVGHALAGAAGIDPDHLIAVVSHERERVTAAIGEIATALGHEVLIAEQDEPLGTGDAARAGLTALPGDFDGTVVITVADAPLLDAPTLQALLDVHSGAAVTLTGFIADDPTGYGRIVRDADDAVTAIVEHKDADERQRAISEVNAGIYAFDAATLRTALSALSTDNSQGEYYLTDVVEIARNDGKTVRALIIDDPAVVAGCNDRVQLAELGAELNRRIIARHQLAGVTVVDPASTWIDVDVAIGQDVTIEPGTQLRGRTSIGPDAVVGPDTTLTDVVVGEGAQVIRTHGSDAVIGAGATVGPFAYLRPGTELGANGRIGTFVETKNAQIGAGSKIPHLTYVGDATIGEQSNIGASSVFVNYDGVNKHRTVIGSHCRTGSDNMFVAPVTVGDGAYTGAGTVVRQNVPPGALAVSAGEQRTIDGWVVAKRPDSAAARAAQAAADSPTTEDD